VLQLLQVDGRQAQKSDGVQSVQSDGVQSVQSDGVQSVQSDGVQSVQRRVGVRDPYFVAPIVVLLGGFINVQAAETRVS